MTKTPIGPVWSLALPAPAASALLKVAPRKRTPTIRRIGCSTPVLRTMRSETSLNCRRRTRADRQLKVHSTLTTGWPARRKTVRRSGTASIQGVASAKRYRPGSRRSPVVNHYSGWGIEPSWTSEPRWARRRNVPGLGRLLAATQYNSEAPVLQIVDLHGDIVETASMSQRNRDGPGFDRGRSGRRTEISRQRKLRRSTRGSAPHEFDCDPVAVGCRGDGGT